MRKPDRKPWETVLRFIWDPAKNDENIRRHGFDFTDAHWIFSGPMLVALDDREEYGEDRWVGLGFIDARVVVVVFTEPNDETIRVISLRKALRREEQRLFRYIEDGLDED